MAALQKPYTDLSSVQLHKDLEQRLQAISLCELPGPRRQKKTRIGAGVPRQGCEKRFCEQLEK